MTAQLALDLDMIRVHCFTCAHVVESPDPQEAHDRMERHYRERHAVLIAKLAALLTGPQVPEGLAERLDELTPSAYLVMEVLAARHRLGEPSWPFPSRHRGMLRQLEDAGLIGFKSDIIEGNLRAWLTDDGVAGAISDTYVSPLEAKLAERDRRDAFLDDDTIRLAEAAADVAEVLPDGWSVVSVGGTAVTVRNGGPGRPFLHVQMTSPTFFTPWVHGEPLPVCDTPADAARAALAALSGDPTDG